MPTDTVSSVIALGRSVRQPMPTCNFNGLPECLLHQLTGNRGLEVRAGCASTSFYKRKSAQSNGSTGDQSADQAKEACNGGVGCWDCVWSGRANYLSQGEERNWGVSEVMVVPSLCRSCSSTLIVPGHRAQRGRSRHFREWNEEDSTSGTS